MGFWENSIFAMGLFSHTHAFSGGFWQMSLKRSVYVKNWRKLNAFFSILGLDGSSPNSLGPHGKNQHFGKWDTKTMTKNLIWTWNFFFEPGFTWKAFVQSPLVKLIETIIRIGCHFYMCAINLCTKKKCRNNLCGRANSWASEEE